MLGVGGGCEGDEEWVVCRGLDEWGWNRRGSLAPGWTGAAGERRGPPPIPPPRTRRGRLSASRVETGAGPVGLGM